MPSLSCPTQAPRQDVFPRPARLRPTSRSTVQGPLNPASGSTERRLVYVGRVESGASRVVVAGIRVRLARNGRWN